MSHDETCGVGSLINIWEHKINQFGSAVVRWCPKCGSVVVDEDYDGRTRPGAFRTFQCPESVKEMQRLEHALKNIYVLARRVMQKIGNLRAVRNDPRATDADGVQWLHAIRLCKAAGLKPSILREIEIEQAANLLKETDKQ